MPKDLQWYRAKASELIERGSFNDAIWMIENLNMLVVGNKIDVPGADILLAPESLCIIYKSRKVSRDRLKSICSSTGELVPEEWMLIISEFSSLYSGNSFLTRNGVEVSDRALEESVEIIHRVTDGFSNVHFQAQLKSARRRHPNPLPPVVA